jgi:hypothetical protein
LSISSNAISLGTVPVSSGGTGATTLTSGSLLKGNGTSAISAATAGTDYSAGTSALGSGILKSTTSTGALTIATASDFPTLNQNTTGSAASVSGTVAVANGGTGATTLTSGALLKGNGTSAISAATAGTHYSAGTSALGTGILKSTTSTGALTIATASDFPTLNQNTTGSAASVSGTVAVANGGTGLTSTPANGQIDIGNGTGFTRAILTAGTSISITNSSGAITIAAVVRMNSDEFTAAAAQTVFTFTTTSSTTGAVQTPLSKPYMYINGIRIKNSAFTWTTGATAVTYVPANNNSYTLFAGDRITFDYAY